MVEREYIVSRWANGHNSQQLPILVVKEKDVNSKPYRWKWGIRDKTGWDLIGLLLGPVLFSGLLFILGQYFEGRAKAKEEYFNSERNKQEILRSYLTTMTNLISQGKLNDENKTPPTNQAAKALTQSALTSFDKAVLPPKLIVVVRDPDKRVLTREQQDAWEKSKPDANRKRQVLQFLNDAQLIKKKSPTIDMAGIDLDGVDLSRFKLTPIMEKNQSSYIFINLKKARLYGANLNYAQLEGADMTGIRLDNANLATANLKGADLSEASLQNANLEGANLEGANLNHADLTGANLTKANLTYSTREDPKTKDIKLIGANLTGAKLEGANLSHAHLNNAILTDADFRYAKGMESVDMTGATFCKTTMPEGTVMTDKCPGQAQ